MVDVNRFNLCSKIILVDFNLSTFTIILCDVMILVLTIIS